jgi:hypothetical protein
VEDIETLNVQAAKKRSRKMPWTEGEQKNGSHDGLDFRVQMI